MRVDHPSSASSLELARLPIERCELRRHACEALARHVLQQPGSGLAQLGLVLSGPLLSPVVGWKIYVYGSFVAGAAAVLLGAHALSSLGEPSQRTRSCCSCGW